MKTASVSVLALLMLGTISTTALAGQVRTDGQDIILSTKGGLKLETEDKSASFQVGGRLQWDYTLDDTNFATGENRTAEDFDARRARISVSGHFGDFEYEAEFNLAESDDTGDDVGGSAEDLYITYTGFGDMANITVGKQRVPFAMDELTSANNITLLERSAMAERYALERSAGVKFSGVGMDKRFTYGVGVFEAAENGENDFEDRAVAGRVTFAPIMTKNRLLHLGAGYQSIGAADPARETDSMNFELAGVYGPLHAQAEYFDSEVGSQNFDGYYAQVGYILNGGGSRPYRDGIFRRVQAVPGGTWEIAARYEEGDGRFNDVILRTPDNRDVSRFDGQQTSLGLNYYMSDAVRIGVSYMEAESNTSELEGSELRMRLQFTF